MNRRFFDGTVRFEEVRGVGTMQVDFAANQRAYVLIGENGIGKTKFLESLFTVLLLASKKVQNHDAYRWVRLENIPFRTFDFQKLGFMLDFSELSISNGQGFDRSLLSHHANWQQHAHELPVIYLAAQGRGVLNHSGTNIQKLGDFQERSANYFDRLQGVLQHPQKFKSLNMDTDIKQWIIQRAQSANPYQAKEDNRKIEIDTLLDLMNRIDERIDRAFLEISGDHRVFVKVEGKKTEMSDLSSGFTSILKILQSIIAGYSYFTNETQIAHVRGVVLIDEIESHLHNTWQVNIVPLLKTLFPNTTFCITTHSSLVISQLEQGEVYRLARSKEDGVVYGEVVDYPSQASIVDLLHEGFGVDLNNLKIERAKERSQKEAKQALLDLVRQELEKVEK